MGTLLIENKWLLSQSSQTHKIPNNEMPERINLGFLSHLLSLYAEDEEMHENNFNLCMGLKKAVQTEFTP